MLLIALCIISVRWVFYGLVENWKVALDSYHCLDIEQKFQIAESDQTASQLILINNRITF